MSRGDVYLAILSLMVLSTCLQVCSGGDKYAAAVVEFVRGHAQSNGQKTLAHNMARYQHIVQRFRQTARLQNGIIVFPECGLVPMSNSSDVYVAVPEPSLHRVNFTHSPVISGLSQAARDSQLYVVVNLLESDGAKRYNTDVVFRSNGTIAARYRKYNLYGEPVDRTERPEIVSFTTEWNVTFGMFTCFDVLYPHPALDLVKSGVRHFVMPTAWFSELPFLTAVQYQKSWAWSNDVTLLASGLGDTSVGHTGSGIYLGRDGPTLYYQAVKTTSTMIISAELSSVNSEYRANPNIESVPDLGEPQASPDNSPASSLASVACRSLSFTHFYWHSTCPLALAPPPQAKDTAAIPQTSYKSLLLKHEDLTAFSLQTIGLENCSSDTEGNFTADLLSGETVKCSRRIEQRVCNRGLCCSFNLTYIFSLCKEPCQQVRTSAPDDFGLSVHALAVFNGVRSFGVATGGLQVCGVIPCRNLSRTSCGLSPIVSDHAFSLPSAPQLKIKILRRHVSRLHIKGRFDTQNAFLSPDLLLGHGPHDKPDNTFGILPNDFSMKVDDRGSAELEFRGDRPSPLGTAAIFNRIFDRDDQPATKASSAVTAPCLLFLIFALFLRTVI